MMAHLVLLCLSQNPCIIGWMVLLSLKQDRWKTSFHKIYVLSIDYKLHHSMETNQTKVNKNIHDTSNFLQIRRIPTVRQTLVAKFIQLIFYWKSYYRRNGTIFFKSLLFKNCDLISKAFIQKISLICFLAKGLKKQTDK